LEEGRAEQLAAHVKGHLDAEQIGEEQVSEQEVLLLVDTDAALSLRGGTDNRAMATIAEATEKIQAQQTMISEQMQAQQTLTTEKMQAQQTLMSEQMQAQQTLMSEQMQQLRDEIRNLVSGGPAPGRVSGGSARGLAVHSASVNQPIDPHTQDLLEELKALAAEQKLAPEMYQKLCLLHGIDDKVAGKQGTGKSLRKVEWVCNEPARKLTAEQARTQAEEQAQKLVAKKAGNQAEKEAQKQVEEQLGKQVDTQEQASEAEEQTTTKGLGSADIELVAQLSGHPYIDKWLIAGNGVEGLERCEQMLTTHFSVSFTFTFLSDAVLVHAPVPG
jgi:hypothetical protein